MKLWQLIWPSIEPLKPAELANDRQETMNDTAEIRAMSVQQNQEQFLEAARGVQEVEAGRKAAAETRAAMYITATAALIPLLTWIVTNGPAECGAESWPLWRTGFFAASVIYLMGAAYWSLKAMSVTAYHCIAVETLMKIHKSGEDLTAALTRETLLIARRNRDAINEKITYVKVTQEWFFRAVAVQGFLLIADPAARIITS